MTDFEFILATVPSPTTGVDRIQLHCTGHDEPLLLGEWPVSQSDEDYAAYHAGVTQAVTEHRDSEHG